MTFLNYLLETSVCAAVLWVAYYALLRKETHFAFNRFYLLSVIPLSGIIPLLRLPLLPPEEYSPVIFMEEFSAGPLAAPVTQSFSPVMPLLIIYFSGAGFVAFRFCRQLYLMRRIIAASRFSDTKNYSAFTFFRKIYINRSTLSAGDYEKILWHEQAHARQLHSVDLAIAQLFVMFQWFNPIAWQLKKSIVATHEYLADAQVLARGVDVNIYQKLLFHQTTGVHPEYANGFNYSLTKKRLIMMTKNNTGKFFALKLCCMLPAIVLPVALFGLSTAEMPSPVNTEKTVVATITPPDTLFINNGKSGATIITVSKSGETLVLSGNNEQLKEQLKDLSPDNISSITVRKGAAVGNANKEEDTATITIIMKSGETLILSGTDEQLKEQLNDLSPDNISSITVQKGAAAGNANKEEDTATITIITKSGETLILSGTDEQLKEQLNDLSPDNISSITVQKGAAAGKAQTPPIYQAGAVDVQPDYPGGMAKLSEFIRANLKYSVEAAKKKIQGRVTVEFIIKADGTIDDVKVLKSVDPLLDAEAMRVLKAMPAWTPGQHKGKPVAVHFILPITFQIPKDKEAETKVETPKDGEIYQVGAVDVQPEYPGGVAKLSEFVRANLKYPIEAAKKNIQGRVVVEFIILADGKMDDIKVTKSVDRLLDAEAIRIVKAMSKSKWTPGKLNGEPVAVRFILPVSFSLK